MTCHDVEPLLSELIDGALQPSALAQVERHLERCPDCRAMLADLRAISRTAATLERHVPPESVWQRIAKRLRPLRRAEGTPARLPRWGPRQPSAASEVGRWGPTSAHEGARPSVGSGLSRTWSERLRPQLALAAAALLVVTAVLALWLREGYRPSPQPADSIRGPTQAPADAGVDDVVQAVQRDYQKAIVGLEQIARTGGKALDPEVAAALDQNIAIVDHAIVDARVALETEPQDEDLRAGLLDAFRSKIELLEQMVKLINEMRQGDQAEAAEIIGNMNR